MTITLRPEQESDQRAIYDLTARAFATMPYADGDEQDVIERLRAAGALALSLVAERDATLVGQITFSPAVSADGGSGWFTLGPVSVEPECQKHDIGGQLIRAGVKELEDRGAAGCILVGNPAYYSRFGFTLAPTHAPADGHAEFFQMIAFGENRAVGVFGFHPAFSDQH